MVRCLAESYSFYLFQTRNFPWDNSLTNKESIESNTILDVATGLVLGNRNLDALFCGQPDIPLDRIVRVSLLVAADSRHADCQQPARIRRSRTTNP